VILAAKPIPPAAVLLAALQLRQYPRIRRAPPLPASAARTPPERRQGHGWWHSPPAGAVDTDRRRNRAIKGDCLHQRRHRPDPDRGSGPRAQQGAQPDTVRTAAALSGHLLKLVGGGACPISSASHRTIPAGHHRLDVLGTAGHMAIGDRAAPRYRSPWGTKTPAPTGPARPGWRSSRAPGTPGPANPRYTSRSSVPPPRLTCCRPPRPSTAEGQIHPTPRSPQFPGRARCSRSRVWSQDRRTTRRRTYCATGGSRSRCGATRLR